MDFTDLISIMGSTENCMQLKKKADELRQTLCTYDKSLLENKNLKLNIGNLSNAPDGRFVIPYNGVDFDCLFKRNLSTDKLYVVFSGARNPGQSEPTFKRWSYYKYLDGSVLNIDDPMCKKHPDLGLGWYYGTKDESYCDYIVDIINNFALQNDHNDIVFWASSGGGYAALYCACKIKKSTAIVINPQIRLNLFTGAKNFQTVTGLDLTARDKFERNHLPELIRDAKDTKFIFVENCASDTDVVQLNDLCAVLNTNYHYGLNLLAPNTLLWVYEGESDQPHNAQEYYPMIYSIAFLEKHFDTAMRYNDIFLILSELWNDHYNLVCELQKVTHKARRRIDCIATLPDAADMTARFKKVIDNFDVEIPAKDNPYNFHCVYDKLEPNSLYKFVLGNIKVISGNTVKYSILVKDNLTYTVDFVKNFDLTNRNIYIYIYIRDKTQRKRNFGYIPEKWVKLTTLH